MAVVYLLAVIAVIMIIVFLYYGRKLQKINASHATKLEDK